MIFDGQGRCLQVNKKGYEMMGVRPSELLGKKFAGFWSEDESGVVEGAMSRAINGESVTFDVCRNVSNGKEGLMWQVHLKPIAIEGSNSDGFVAIAYNTAGMVKLEQTVETQQQSLSAVSLELKESNACLSKAESDLQKSGLEIVHALTRAAEFRDDDTGSHIKRIGAVSRYISELLEMDESFCSAIEYAGSMHDVGKIGVPDAILLKTSGLTEDEFIVMKQHTTMGADLLQSGTSNDILNMGKDIALNHHEKWDGTGYPSGLSANEIPLAARIVMLADHYDALRSNRPYRKGYSHQEVVHLMVNGDGRTLPSHFDPNLLELFMYYHLVFNNMFTET